MRDAADRAAQVARLPREVERDPRHAAVRKALAAETRRLWSESRLETPVVRLTPELRAALATPTVRAVFVRGLEGAEAALAAEARGLAAAPGAAPEPRVSRVLLAANDGAERLYRQLERLVRVHAPRLMVCLVDAPAEELGGAIFGPGAAAKVALTSHKDAAARVLLALAASDVS